MATTTPTVTTRDNSTSRHDEIRLTTESLESVDVERSAIALPPSAPHPHRYHCSADFPYYTHRRFAPPGSIPASSRRGDNIVEVLPLPSPLAATLSSGDTGRCVLRLIRSAERHETSREAASKPMRAEEANAKVTAAAAAAAMTTTTAATAATAATATVAAVATRWSCRFALRRHFCRVRATPANDVSTGYRVPSRDSHHARRTASREFSPV